MKKCSGCERDIDKYAIACQYCGKLLNLRKEAPDPNRPAPAEKKGQKRQGDKRT